jgi:hypothetical protein
MKNTLLLTALLAAFSFCKAQIFWENSYNADYLNFHTVRLEHAGYKYYVTDSNKINIYNIDHTLYKQIVCPIKLGRSIGPHYLSEALFDTDSTTLEYVAVSTIGSFPFVPLMRVEVYREDGNLLFGKDSVFMPFANHDGYTQPNNPLPVINTDQGAKMFLVSGSTLYPETNVLVYSLPGLLPCDVCDGQRAVGTGLPSDGYNTQFKLYPNPSNNYTIIEYDLPKDIDNASLVVYNTAGQEQRRFKVDKGSRQMVLPTSEFAAGTYYYSLEIPGLGTTGKKALVIH